MSHHRFREQLAQSPLFRAPEPATPLTGFVLCPLALVPPVQGGMFAWQQVYQMAFEQAQAVVRPSLPERDLLGVWN
jgi:hypothetical protein